MRQLKVVVAIFLTIALLGGFLPLVNSDTSVKAHSVQPTSMASGPVTGCDECGVDPG